MASNDPLPQIRGYHLVRLLGRGGQGEVYAAKTNNGASVAIKILLAEANRSQQALDRFFREISLLRGLSHPSLVEVYDSGISDDLRPWYSMELLSGHSASSELENGPLKTTRAVEIICALCEAVSYLHTKGILHRDIKPENVFITDDGTPKLLDLGISKSSDQALRALTRTGEIFGTPGYMPREQYYGKGDTRVDIYALGAVLYVLLAAVLPYNAQGVELATCVIAKEAPVQLRERVASVPVRLASIIHRCLAHDPDQRPASADKLAELLRPYQRPRDAHPSSPLATRERGMSRGFVAVAALVVLASAIGFLLVKSWLDGLSAEVQALQEKTTASSGDGPLWRVTRSEFEALREDVNRLRSTMRGPASAQSLNVKLYFASVSVGQNGDSACGGAGGLCIAMGGFGGSEVAAGSCKSKVSSEGCEDGAKSWDPMTIFKNGKRSLESLCWHDATAVCIEP